MTTPSSGYVYVDTKKHAQPEALGLLPNPVNTSLTIAAFENLVP